MNHGGSFKRGKDGKPVRVAGTEDHPEGNRPRDAQGKPLDVMAKPLEVENKGVNHGAEVSKENPASKN